MNYNIKNNDNISNNDLKTSGIKNRLIDDCVQILLLDFYDDLANNDNLKFSYFKLNDNKEIIYLELSHREYKGYIIITDEDNSLYYTNVADINDELVKYENIDDLLEECLYLTNYPNLFSRIRHSAFPITKQFNIIKHIKRDDRDIDIELFEHIKANTDNFYRQYNKDLKDFSYILPLNIYNDGDILVEDDYSIILDQLHYIEISKDKNNNYKAILYHNGQDVGNMRGYRSELEIPTNELNDVAIEIVKNAMVL